MMRGMLTIGFFLLFLAPGCSLPRTHSLEERVEMLRASEKLLREATLALRQLEPGALERAERLYQLAFELTPREAKAADGLGCVAIYRGDFKLASKWFNRAIQLDHAYHPAKVHLALSLELQGQRAKAEKILRLVVEQVPLDYKAKNNLAAMLLDMNYRDPEARELLLKAAELAPSDNLLIIENLKTFESGSEIGGQLP